MSVVRPKTKLVLFVDDYVDGREPHAFALRDAGFLVDEVATLEEAMAVAPRLTPDIIVLDRYLPDGDGWDAARKFKALPSLHDVPIIGFTANLRGRADVENALVAGCDILLDKPCSPSVLVRHVLGLLGLPFDDVEESSATVRKLA